MQDISLKKIYREVEPDKAYRLLNTGSVVLVATQNKENVPNLAPIAWQCPLNYDPVTKLLIVCASENKTLQNIIQTGKFVTCLPHASQVEMVKLLGSCSGHDVNKIEKFGIRTFSSGRFQMQVPEGCIGYIECEMFKTVEDDDVTVVFGRAVHAAADEQAFSGRLMPERPEGKTLHHLGAKIFMVPGDKNI